MEILDRNNPAETGHFWALVMNIRDKRFEVLDSARTFEDGSVMMTATKIIDGIKENWAKHYGGSSVQISNWPLMEIKCPKKNNRQEYIQPYRVLFFIAQLFSLIVFFHFHDDGLFFITAHTS